MSLHNEVHVKLRRSDSCIVFNIHTSPVDKDFLCVVVTQANFLCVVVAQAGPRLDQN
jgi:hypothetical protein